MIERLKIAFIGIAVWWALLLPFDYTLFNWFFTSIQKPFYTGLQSIDSSLLFETDTYGTYLVLVLSVSLGVLSSFATKLICKKLNSTPTSILKTILAGILFFFLFKYGWDKVTKSQFYLPEPNTVYTPFGKLTKDIAYWSLVGSSYSYTFVLGCIELFTALLFIFKRTQFLASLLSIAIFGQILLINCSFDISVKLLSGSLLCFSLIYTACFPQNWRAIMGFSNKTSFRSNTQKHQIVKGVFVLLVLLESILPSVLSGNLNDDQYPRLKHHGAYRVIGSKSINRIFIHRNHYLILELSNGKFVDLKLDTQNPMKYSALDTPISCLWNGDQMKLVYKKDTFNLQELPYRQLPLLQESFHPFSDEFH